MKKILHSKMLHYKKWSILYPKRYPESIQCSSCKSYFSIAASQNCQKCNYGNNVSNIIAKIRPCILWISQSNWFKNMTFAIPISASGFYSDSYNELVSLNHYNYSYQDERYHKPFRAVIYEATRVDGSAFTSKQIIGSLTDKTIQQNIENKLSKWIFDF